MQEKGSNRRTKNPVLRNGTAVQKSYDSRYEKENFRAIQQMMCKGHLFCRHTTDHDNPNYIIQVGNVVRIYHFHENVI